MASVSNTPPPDKTFFSITRKRYRFKMKSHFSESWDPSWFNYYRWEHWGNQVLTHLSTSKCFGLLPISLILFPKCKTHYIHIHEISLLTCDRAQRSPEVWSDNIFRLSLQMQRSPEEFFLTIPNILLSPAVLHGFCSVQAKSFSHHFSLVKNTYNS